MNKSHRTSQNEKFDILHASPKKQHKQEKSHRKMTVKKSKDLSVPNKAKRLKNKQLNTSKKQYKVRLSEDKSKREKSKDILLSPLKSHKKSKELMKNKLNKNEIRELQRQRMLQKYLKSRYGQFQKQKSTFNQSTQFFLPLTQAFDKENPIRNISEFLSSQQSYIQQDIPSSMSASPSYQKFEQQSNLKQSHLISVQQWQKYETLKLKNEQLANYIEQLQKIQKKFIEQKKQHENMIKSQIFQQKEQFRRQYAELNERNIKVSSDNAILQQMFNQRQSAILTLKQENATLIENAIERQQYTHNLQNEKDKLQNNMDYLQKQITILKKSMGSIHSEKDQFERKYKLCCLQKEKVKSYALEMLTMVKKLQIQHIQHED